MKTLIAILILGSSFPVNAYESIGDRSNRKAYESQKGYAYENKCFRYEYREKYIPGTASNPGYIRQWEERLQVNCNYSGYSNSTNSGKNNYSKNNSGSCERSTIGALLGGGLAAGLSAVDAYGWSIPLGAVLGRGIANNSCN